MAVLGNRIKQLRIEKGLTQEQLGNILNIGKSTVSQYETGINTPDINMAGKIADYFNVSVDWLLGRTDQRELPEKDQSTIDDIDVEKIFIAAHDESGKPVPATEGLKKLIKEVILEVRNEKSNKKDGE